YRRPDADPDFLSRDDVRGIRLMLDYMKPELILEQAVVKHTVVVFGSTRILERAGAARDLDAAQAALARDPNNAALARQVKVAERVLAKSRYYDVARDFGRLVGGSNFGLENQRVVVMTGGGPG